MGKISEQFIEKGTSPYKFKLGTHAASALSGFIAGFLFASIIWVLIFYYKATLGQ